MKKCVRCKKGDLKVIARGYYGNSLIVHCQNPQCDVIYEMDIDPEGSGNLHSESEVEE